MKSLIQNAVNKLPYLRKLKPSGKEMMKIGYLLYQCNICGEACETRVDALDREQPSCPNCGSTVRMRAIIHMLSLELFGKSIPLPEFPHMPDIKGVGMSDWVGYAFPLAHKLGYTNTFYHKEPKLDITSIEPSRGGTLDFIISSDVFEHVAPPVSVAFANACRLLKPSGVMIFIVPYINDLGSVTKEHFSDLYQYKIIKTSSGYILKNSTREGVEQVFDNLVFHGGEGSTLEMRVFSESSLLEEFHKAGFSRVKIYREPYFDYGIYWKHDWSLPMAARV